MSAKTLFIENLIREHATKSFNGYSLHLNDIPQGDKKLLLSYVVGIYEYEWLSGSKERLDAAFTVYERELQAVIDTHIDDVYRSDMEEMDLSFRSHANNGEFYLTKRA